MTPGPDTDLDGVSDGADVFPCDWRRSAVTFAPSEHDFATLLFEDNWPAQGDLDFNDAVLLYNVAVFQDGSGAVTGLRFTLIPRAIGASIASGVALRLPVAASSIVSIVRTVGAGSPMNLAVLGGESELVVPLVSDLRELFDGSAGYLNTDPALAAIGDGQRVVVDLAFQQPVPQASAREPFDLYLFRSTDPRHQIHRPQFSGTDTMLSGLFGTADDGSTEGRWFVGGNGLPFVLSLPLQSTWPRELQPVDGLWPAIVDFAASGGTTAQDYYVVHTNAEKAFGPVSVSSVPGVDYAACLAPTCGDAVRNGRETAIDCGGDCPGCDLGQSCAVHDDCAGGVCVSGACVDAGERSCTVSHGSGTQQRQGSGWATCQATTCEDGYRVSSGACVLVTYAWDSGAWSTCGGGTVSPGYGTWGACSGGSGTWGYGSWNACTASAVCSGSGSQSRTASCNYAANSGGQSRAATCQWDPSSGSQARTVRCLDSFGEVASADRCPGGAPTASQPCTPTDSPPSSCSATTVQSCTPSDPAVCGSAVTSQSCTSPSGARACTVANGTGTESCASGSTTWGACTITACNSGYHQESGACASDTRACAVANGTGTQTWDGVSAYGACTATGCNSGFALSGGTCTAIVTCAAGSRVYAYTGVDQGFRVPPGCTSMTVTLWGAGGGGGDATRPGGGAGAATAVVPVTPGESLVVVVGGGGGPGSGPAAYGGGGAKTGAIIGNPGRGGGLSGLFRGAAMDPSAPANALVIAGGGGGSVTNGSGTGGGAGGGTAGGAVSLVGACTGASGGNPGTQTAAGAAPTPYGGTAGTQFFGGASSLGDDGGGGSGAGGWFGGSAGSDCADSGGGGGSGRLNAAAGVTGTLYAGSGGAAGLASDARRTGSAGAGATDGNSGMNGLVVIEYGSGTVASTCPSTSVTLDYTGAVQTYSVPAGCTEVQVVAWGAGGGGGSAIFPAGGGGATVATVPVTAGETLSVVVGGGGGVGAGAGAYGGGGAKSGTFIGNAGRGGGLSGVFRGTALDPGAPTNALVIAGGGGGATTNSSWYVGAGGSGGGSVGGTSGAGLLIGGGGGGFGGSQSAGGVAPTTGGGVGGRFAGGHGNLGDDGGNGSGGGGWFGGGGGSDSTDTGGGGGSSYVNARAGVWGVLHPAIGATPALSSDARRGTAGNSATTGGSAGRVVLVTGPAPSAPVVAACTSGSATFDYTGAGQTFVVPAGCTRLTVTAFGAGGGGGNATFQGGGGGGAVALVEATPGERLGVAVGGGGAVGAGAGAYGGGGPKSGSYIGNSGRGGGLSGVFRGSILQVPLAGNALVIAGGGGGATSNAPATRGGGGAGGGLTGGTADPRAAGSGGGGGFGASQTAGGAAPAQGGGAGSQFLGGHGNLGDDGGNASGGGGWFGGGGGSDTTDNGGGGGSGYLNATQSVRGTLYTGSGSTPGNSASAVRGGLGAGATAGGAGAHGRVVIAW